MNRDNRRKNKKILLEYGKEYRRKNKIILPEGKEEYQRKNRDKMKEYNKQYKARVKDGGELTIHTIQLVYEDNIKRYGTLTCYLCLHPILFRQDSLEHKIPLSRSGTNEYNNLGVACGKCNSQKGTKTEEEYRLNHA